MSWLSAALKRNKLDVLNKIAKPVQAVVNPMIDKMPVIGSLKAGAEAVGNYIPQIGGKGTLTQRPDGTWVNAFGQPRSAPGTDTGGGPGLPGLGVLGAGLGGALGNMGSALGGNNGMNALAFAQLLNAAQLGKKSGALANEALNTQRDLFAQKAPLRSAGVAGMQAPRTELPQLAKLGAISNPFATGGR